jgi:ribosomal protein L37AE/L43A
MKTIDPNYEDIHCPRCSGWDVRYRRSEGYWRCRECGQCFTADGKIRIKKLECREGEEG